MIPRLAGSDRRTLIFRRILLLVLVTAVTAAAQLRPKVTLIGGDDVPQLKQQVAATLETLLLEMNRLSKATGDINALRTLFTPDAFAVFEQYVVRNGAYCTRKQNEAQMIQRGTSYDIRSINVKINVGETEASEFQNLVFTFSRAGLIISVRAVLPTYDFQTVVVEGKDSIDRDTRAFILDFMERFRMAYNSKDIDFLEKVYSDDALILVGTVLQEKRTTDDFMRTSGFSQSRIRLIQQTKREYLDALKNRAFRRNSFINVRFDDFTIVQHERIPWLYGVSCWQQLNSSSYSDRGYLFLMMDFRKREEPVIHVRAWQPKKFEGDADYISLYDFKVVGY